LSLPTSARPAATGVDQPGLLIPDARRTPPRHTGCQASAPQPATLALSALADARQTGSAWAGLDALVQQQAQQRYQERQVRLAGLSEAERKAQSRCMVLTEDDCVRLQKQKQKAAQFIANLPLRPRDGVMDFIHESVFEHCLAQRRLGLLDQPVVSHDGRHARFFRAVDAWAAHYLPDRLSVTAYPPPPGRCLPAPAPPRGR
jgi:hypothetical protein